MRDYDELKKQMLKVAEERQGEIVGYDVYIDELAKVMYDFINDFDLSFDIDYTESSSDSWLYKTVRVPKLVGEQGYNVILDVDFRSSFESAEDFVDCLIDTEKSTIEFLSHFQK